MALVTISISNNMTVSVQWLFEPCEEHQRQISKVGHKLNYTHRYLCPNCMGGLEHANGKNTAT